MSTSIYPTSVHITVAVAALGLALALALVGCGGEVSPDVDQLVHEGPVPSPRPPRPVALERSTGTLIRFSPHDGELSARLAAVEGTLVDVATDGDVVWTVVDPPRSDPSPGRRVVAIDAAGMAWSRPVRARRLEALGQGAVAVFADDDWWALGTDGGVLWHRPAREVVQAWPSPEGVEVVTGRGSRRSLWVLTPSAATFVGSFEAHGEVLAPSSGFDDVPLALSLAEGYLHVRSADAVGPAAVVALDGRGLLAAHPLPARPGAVALLVQEPPAVAVLTTSPELELAVQPLDVPPLEGVDEALRALAAQERRLFVATGAGVVAVDVTEEANGVILSVPPSFDGRDLTAPLVAPQPPP